MKRWLYLAAALTAVGIISRLPHPARDISELKPVRAVYLYMDDGKLNIETDTGDRGAGSTLRKAAEDMKEGADGEIFLDTAEFLLLSPEVPITEEYFTLLRPSCRVAYTETAPDLKTVSDFLSIHKPETTLAHRRALTTRPSAFNTQHEQERSPHASR